MDNSKIQSIVDSLFTKKFSGITLYSDITIVKQTQTAAYSPTLGMYLLDVDLYFTKGIITDLTLEQIEKVPMLSIGDVQIFVSQQNSGVIVSTSWDSDKKVSEQHIVVSSSRCTLSMEQKNIYVGDRIMYDTTMDAYISVFITPYTIFDVVNLTGNPVADQSDIAVNSICSPVINGKPATITTDDIIKVENVQYQIISISNSTIGDTGICWELLCRKR